MASPKYQDTEGQRCIQLIRCIRSTPEERANPLYVPQLEIDKTALDIIARRFVAPISIIIYVGNMGVGKSKLATVTVAALTEKQHHEPYTLFQSGVGVNGVTEGVWMWSHPLQHFDEEYEVKGSIMLLDYQGMGDLDEHAGANLYLFCMLISTAFAVVLRPSRVDRSQCDRLYHALQRFEHLRMPCVLPNVCLMPLNLPDFVYTDSDSGEDVIIEKEKWIENIFKLDEINNTLSTAENDELKRRYKYIHQMLPKIDATTIHYLPSYMFNNARSVNIKDLLQKEESKPYLKSILKATGAFLANGGKRLLGSTNERLYIRPAELAKLMSNLVDTINQDKIPNPNRLIETFLNNRVSTEIEKECVERFKRDILDCAKRLCESMTKPQVGQEIADMDQELRDIHAKLKTKHFDTIIRRTRHEILGLDRSLSPEFQNEDQRQRAYNSLPETIQHHLNTTLVLMNDIREAEMLIERARNNLTIADIRQQFAEKQKLFQELEERLNEKKLAVQNQKRINQSLEEARIWRVGVAPCICGAPGRAYNMLHINCDEDPEGNLYYYRNYNNKMVCDECQKIIRCEPDHARCTTCERLLTVTRIF